MKNPFTALLASPKSDTYSPECVLEQVPEYKEPIIHVFTIPPTRSICLVLCDFNQTDTVYKRLKALQHHRRYNVTHCYNLVAKGENRIGYIPVECVGDVARDTLEADVTYIPGVLKVDNIFISK